MDRRAFLAAAIAALASPAFAQPAGADPLAPVKVFYDPKVTGWENRPFSKKLRALYNAATKKSNQLKEPVSGIDFDPATGAQDNDDDMLKTIEYAVASRDAAKALVAVTLKVFKDQPETTIHYEMVLEGKDWKVDDIVNPAKTDGWRWSEMLKLGAKGQ